MRDFHLPGRSPVLATNGMCATSHPLAAKVAIQMLEAGGNAVDAAIAGAVLLGICEPQMTGIGGDCFALVSKPGTDRIVALNGSGRAPAGLDPAALRDGGHRTMPLGDAASVTMPGAVDAFCRLAADHGRMGLATLLAPTIHYAETGIPVAPRVASDWARDAATLQGRARDHYLFGDRPPAPGQVFRAPGQAEVLRRVAADGPAAFYEGEVAEDMLRALRDAGGPHEPDDFASVGCDYADPVAGDYRGTELLEHPPNGQGATAILLARILAHFDLAAMDPLGADRAHLEAEAAKLAHDARDRFLADPDHSARLGHMLDDGTARKLADLVTMDRAMAAPAELAGSVHKDTVHIAVVDRDRMAVSLIYSIFRGFGSGIASEKFGILMHNRGIGFTLEPGHPNEAGPGKRPLHTIIPAMLRQDGRVTMPFGVMGGGYQPTGHVRLLSNLVDFGMDPQEAIDAPRAFADGDELKVERGYADAVREDLARRGHRVVTPGSPLGGAQAIHIDESGMLVGASDARKDGCALGY